MSKRTSRAKLFAFVIRFLDHPVKPRDSVLDDRWQVLREYAIGTWLQSVANPGYENSNPATPSFLNLGGGLLYSYGSGRTIGGTPYTGPSSQTNADIMNSILGGDQQAPAAAAPAVVWQPPPPPDVPAVDDTSYLWLQGA